MINMKNLVIGEGQIGTAVKAVLECESHDINQIDKQKFDVIHICIPYSDSFIDIVRTYQERYEPTHTVIHSTVPVGTSRKLKAIHSPVTGMHPNLESSIRTFKKFFAGEGAEEMAQEFPNSKVLSKPENTEAGKLWMLAIYGLNIMIEKEIHKYCVDNDLDFNEVYSETIEMYNKGYEDMGVKDSKVYKLKHQEGKIGGHCIVQNMKHLEHKLAEHIINYNDSI